MAKRTLTVEIVGDAEKFKKALGGADVAADKSGGKLKAVGKAAAIGLAGGIGVGVVAVKGFIDAAKDSEVVQKRMETQLGALGISYGKHAKAIDKSIQKTSQLSGLDDEDLTDSFTNIVRVTGNVNESLKLNALAADLARAKHIDVAKAGALVAKMAGGNTKALSKYGLVVKDGATKQEALAEAQKRFGGQAEAYGKTAAGAQDRFGVAVENLQEKLGAGLLPIVGAVANAVSGFITGAETGTGAGGKFADAIGGIVGIAKDAVKWVGQNKDVVVDLGIVVGVATAAFVAYRTAQILGAAATSGMAAAQGLLNAAMAANPIGLVVIALVALGAGLVIAYRHSETFRNIVNGAFAAVKTGAEALVNFIKPAIAGGFEFVQGVVERVLPAIVQIFDGFKTTIQGIVDVVAGIFTGDFGRAWTGVKEIFSGALDILVGYVKGITAPMQEAVSLVLGSLTGAFKAAPGALLDVGKWLINRVIDGIKGMVGAIGDAAGWLKNRVVDAIQLYAEGYLTVGRWVLGRVADGITTITDAIGAVGGWIRNRVVEGIHATVDGLVSVGTWIVNRVVDGFTTVTDTLGGIGGWLKNRVSDLVHGAADGFKSVGGAIIDFIVDGLRGGANKLVGFLNDIVHIINKIPGVELGDIKGFAEGGVNKAVAPAQEFAHGGAFARTGGIVTSPITLMGEEAPRYPEFVIPTNPAYRKRAQALLGQAAGTLGFAKGGLFGSISGIVGDLFDGGADFLTSKLPSPDALGWLKGTGKFVLGKAGDFITDKVKGIINGILGDGSSDGGPVPGGQALGKMMAKAAAMDGQHFPYVYGGGHASFSGPWDCSGAVSAVLNAAGLLSSPVSTDQLKTFGEGGDGKLVTIGVRGSTGRNAHTMIKLGSRYFESGSGHGAQWTSGWSGNFPIHRHPAGMAQGGVFGGGSSEPPWGWGLAKGGTFPPFVGAYKDGGTVPRDGMALVHKGERITPARGEIAPVIHIEHNTMNIKRPSDADLVARKLAWTLS